MVYNERRELVTQFGPVEYYMHGSKIVKQTVDSPNNYRRESVLFTDSSSGYLCTDSDFIQTQFWYKLLKANKSFLTRTNVKENYHCS